MTTRYIAHRGMNHQALENTLPALALAREQADGVELDVQLAGCGTPVVLHDDDLERLFGVRGTPRDYTAAELASLRPVARDEREPAGEEFIPTLRQALDLFEEDFFVNVEIKAPELALATPTRAVAEILKASKPRNVLVSSFNPVELARFHVLCPEIPTGLLFHADSSFFFRHGLSAPALRLSGLAALHPSWDLVSYDLIRRAHARGLAVNVWTVNDRERSDWLVREGVDGIISDVPDRMRP